MQHDNTICHTSLLLQHCFTVTQLLSQQLNLTPPVSCHLH
jgi:hypothetical protein